MTERPISCNAREVRALLDGSMTQKRWVVKCHIEDYGGILHTKTVCPYGQPGDRLWVRESIDGIWGCDAHYIADEAHLSEYIKDWWDTPQRLPCKKIPPSRMPRWASRITLEITSERVERLKDINEPDCKAEGAKGGNGSIPGYHYSATPREHYHHIWESINGTGSWDANPWVWVVEFRRVETS